jgi:hypothetical protein
MKFIILQPLKHFVTTPVEFLMALYNSYPFWTNYGTDLSITALPMPAKHSITWLFTETKIAGLWGTG